MLLPQERREAFILYELEGMTLQEIAEMENTSINTIASRVRKARIELAEALRSRKRGTESADDIALDAQLHETRQAARQHHGAVRHVCDPKMASTSARC